MLPMDNKSSARVGFADLEANLGETSSVRTSKTGSSTSQEDEILPENHHLAREPSQALLGATLRANVFNPDFLHLGEQEESAEDAESDQQTDRFPVLLSASMRSNVFNSDFLSLVHERTEAQLEARGLDSQQSLAHRVTSRATGLIDDALGKAVDEELGIKRAIAEGRASSEERSVDSATEGRQPQAGEQGLMRNTTNQPADGGVVDTDHLHREPIEKGKKPAQEVAESKESKLHSFKRAWRFVLRPHSPMAAQLEALLVVIILAGLFLCCLWLAIGRAASPNGAVFALVIVYFAAVFFGELAARVGTHPLVGMLVAGFICRYIPGVKAGSVLPSELTAFIREFGLCTILLRAGIALDIKLLMRLKWLSFACSLFPTIGEATVLAAMSVWLLNLPWTWSYMAGFIVAGVAPAIVVPALLALQDGGYGVAKGIPSLVLAVAAVDDCLSVVGNAVFNSVIFSHSSITMSIFRAPIEIAMGTAVGLGLGLGAILLLPRMHAPGAVIDQDPSNRGPSRRNSGHHRRSGEHTHKRKTNEHVEAPKPAKPETEEDSGSAKVLKALKEKIQPQKILPRVPPGDGTKMAILRTLYVLGFGLWTVIGGQKLKYSGAGALSVVVLGAVAGQGWGRELSSKPKLYLLYTWALLAQPLLFGVIGSQIDVSYFKGSFLWRGVIILPVAALARCFVTVGSTVGTALNTRERLFLALAWLPKATVQASLAPQALSQVKSKNDPALTGYAENVFALGMLSVILTAPLGAMVLKISGPRLLQQTSDKPHQVVHAE